MEARVISVAVDTFSNLQHSIPFRTYPLSAICISLTVSVEDYKSFISILKVVLVLTLYLGQFVCTQAEGTSGEYCKSTTQ